MKTHTRHSDEELLRRIRDEAPELAKAKLTVDLDEVFETLITADPNSVNLNSKRRKTKKTNRKLKEK